MKCQSDRFMVKVCYEVAFPTSTLLMERLQVDENISIFSLYVTRHHAGWLILIYIIQWASKNIRGPCAIYGEIVLSSYYHLSIFCKKTCIGTIKLVYYSHTFFFERKKMRRTTTRYDYGHNSFYFKIFSRI